MKKTLIICSTYPLPENTGANIRTMNFVRFFQNIGPVDIAYSSLLEDGRPGNGIFSGEHYLEKENYPVHRWGWTRALLQRQPYPIRKFKEMSEKKLLSLLEAYDYILVRYIVNAHSLLKLPAVQRNKIILDYDDILSDSLYETLFYPTRSLPKKLTRMVNRALLRKFERDCLGFGATLFCSEEDGRKIKGVLSPHIVPNVYVNEAFENFPFGDGYENGNVLLFVGWLSYPPNRDGLKWFVENIFPDFRRKYRDGKLIVTGRFPTQDIENLCRGEGIELHSEAPDLRPYYKSCRAVLVPLLSGSGTRIKILEAALASRPILSTVKGAEGLALEDSDWLLFEDKEAFMRKYVTLSDRTAYHSLTRNAKRKVSLKYSPAAFQQAMERVLKTVEGNGSLPGAIIHDSATSQVGAH